MLRLKENAFLWLLTGCGAIALALAIANDHEPAGFFVAVRVAVCFASAYAAMKAYRGKKEIWLWLLGANAVLYNPFVLVRLTEEIWSLVSLADIALLVAAGIVLRERDTRPVRRSEPLSGNVPPLAAAYAKNKECRTPSRMEMAAWLALLILVLAGVFMSQYDGYLEGTSQSTAHARAVVSAMLGLAFWGYVIARVRRWRRPGRVALGSLLAGLVAVVAGPMAGGYIRGTETKEDVASIERFDPRLAARLRGGEGSGGVPLPILMSSSLSRAAEQAPDKAVVAFMQERFEIILGDSATALKRCAMAFNGDGNFQLTKSEQSRLMHSIGNLYGAAAAEHRATPTEAERRAATDSLVTVYKKIDPTGILDDEEKRKALSEQEQCALYTQLMTELQSMPPKEGAAAIRAMLAN